MVSARDVSGRGIGEAGSGQCCLEQALRFSELCKEDLLSGNTSEFGDKADLREDPDKPLCGVELPRLDAISIVVLKLVMIVMVDFAEGDDRHQPRVAGAAFGGIRALAQVVAERI